MADARLSLNEIGLHFGTDKASNHHDYLNYYERVFEKFRDSAIRILEIGILDGASVRNWSSYFSKGLVIGGDINPESKRFTHDRIVVETIDQSNIQDLVNLGVKYGPFDIIIEDGSHMWEHQITSLKTLFPFVNSGGVYIVEDLQTNFGQHESFYKGVSRESCVEFLKKALELRVADDAIDISKEEDAFLRTYSRLMNLVFFRRACIIEKLIESVIGNSRRCMLSPPNDDIDRGSLRVIIFAHVGYVGDVISVCGFVKPVDDAYYIQGLRIYLNDQLQEALLYRARLADGAWTDWVGNDEFVGTKAQNLNLTGLSVKFKYELDRRFKVSVRGMFGSVGDFVTVGLGEDCVDPHRLAPLHGVEVRLWADPIT